MFQTPREVAKYEIGDRGTDSPLLQDHKSLLFDKEKNLLVIPVLVAELDENDYEGEIPDWAYGEYVWQGAYVFEITPCRNKPARTNYSHGRQHRLAKKWISFLLWIHSTTKPIHRKRALYNLQH